MNSSLRKDKFQAIFEGTPIKGDNNATFDAFRKRLTTTDQKGQIRSINIGGNRVEIGDIVSFGFGVGSSSIVKEFGIYHTLVSGAENPPRLLVRVRQLGDDLDTEGPLSLLKL